MNLWSNLTLTLEILMLGYKSTTWFRDLINYLINFLLTQLQRNQISSRESPIFLFNSKGESIYFCLLFMFGKLVKSTLLGIWEAWRSSSSTFFSFKSLRHLLRKLFLISL